MKNITFPHSAHSWARYRAESTEEIGAYTRRRFKDERSSSSQQIDRQLQAKKNQPKMHDKSLF